MHMFDIDVEGGQYYNESSVITAGNEICVAETEFGPIGIAICYDVRFPEQFRLMQQRGVKAVVLPASGPLGAPDACTCTGSGDVCPRMCSGR